MNNNTKAFYFLTIIAFALACIGMIIGILRVDTDLQTKGFFAVSYLFSTYASFALAKVVRDKAEQNNKRM